MIFVSLNRAVLTWMRRVSIFVLSSLLMLSLANPAWAALDDDHYDGDIFALYGGNGSLVPPKVKLSDSIKQGKPALLVLYTDDSSDSKQYTTTVSQMQAFYGRAMDILPIRVDSLPVQAQYAPTEPGYYFKGFVPQTVIFNQKGKVVLNETGLVEYEKMDDVLRKVFDLLPRSESTTLKRRAVNEVNTELVPQK